MPSRLLTFLFVLFASTSMAQAQTEQKDEPERVRGRKRAPDASAVASWIPRTLFAPVTCVSELAIRRPANAIIDWAVLHHVPEILHDIVLNPTPDIHWYPIIASDIGYFFAAGAAVKFDNLGARDHALKLESAFGGPNFFQVIFHDTWKAGRFHLSLNGRAFSRSDRSFFGFGPDSNNTLVNFTETRVEGFATATFDAGNHVHLAASEGVRSDQNGPGATPSIETLFPTAAIPGFGGTVLAMATLDARVDSRADVDAPQGAWLAARVAYGRDVNDPERSFVSMHADAEIALEVSKPDRVVTLRAFVSDSVPLGSEPVPFLEQSTLGWDNHVAFHWGRFRDEAAALGEIRYRYPIAYFVDMQWIASVGNVFARDFSNFDVKSMTTSLSIGFRTRRTGRMPLRFLVGVGTTRFDQPFGVESVRVSVSNAEDL